MSLVKSLLLGTAVAAAAVAGAIFVHPDGVRGVAGLVGLDAILEAVQSGPRASEERTGEPAKLSATASTAEEIANGDAAYDAGNFSGAVTFYSVARALAADEGQRRRAEQGLHNAVLGWALTHEPPPPDHAGRTRHERLMELKASARTIGTEDAWLDVALYAVASDLPKEAPAAIQAALDLAVAGGALERRIQAVLPRAETKAAVLREAAAARGLAAPTTTVTTTALRHPTEGDDGPSGIGGSNDRLVEKIRVPFGAFTPEMRRRLERAVEAEREGLEHFAAAGPDGTERNRHRREARKLLIEARDAYTAACEMDPGSRPAERRLQHVMRALALVNKEVVSGN